MIYAVDPPDCSNYRGKGQTPMRSRTMYGPKAEIVAAREKLKFRAELLQPDKDYGLAYLNEDEDEALKGAVAAGEVELIERHDLARLIAGKPLEEVGA